MHGPHVMIDAYGCNQNINSVPKMRELLNTLVERAEMFPLIKPIVLYSDRDPKGISGLILISESHISMHAFQDTNSITVDVYSCKDLKGFKDRIVNTVKEFCEPQKMEVEFVYRGKLYKKTTEAGVEKTAVSKSKLHSH